MPKAAPAPNRVKSMEHLRTSVIEAGTADISLEIGGKRLVFIKFGNIRDFLKHTFHIYTGERLNDMIESVRKNGILMPLLVRRIHDDPDFDYEMLSGHNRKNAGMLAGIEGALCIVKENLPDEEALMYVIETNLMQRSFSDMLPSERAAALTLRYGEMFSQGKRNDIIRELQLLNGETPGETSGTEFHKSLSRDSLGEKYHLTGRSIANYLRLDKLVEPLKKRLDSNLFAIKAGVSLSYLPSAEQLQVENALSLTLGKLSDGKAAEIRRRFEAQELDEQALGLILQDAQKIQTVSVRLPPQTYAKYFQPNTSKAEVEKTIEHALSLYFARLKGLEDTKNA